MWCYYLKNWLGQSEIGGSLDSTTIIKIHNWIEKGDHTNKPGTTLVCYGNSWLLQLGVFRVYYAITLKYPTKVNVGHRICKPGLCVIPACRLHSDAGSVAWLSFEWRKCSQTERRSIANVRRVSSCSEFTIDRPNCNRCYKFVTSPIVRITAKTFLNCWKYGNRAYWITYFFTTSNLEFFQLIRLDSSRALRKKSVITTQTKCKVAFIQLEGPFGIG